ncbi:hypothetical protein [Frankia sp. Cr1]|uniref:hypothetical protein n=1 Tax=Frankia sp. Cr1 TaxID=3073931 RepID=UPI002AD41FD9|nr:hypothetical protein [Frankia sp. Cr1]
MAVTSAAEPPFTGRAVKRSTSFPEDLIREVEARTGPRGFSAAATEALAHWVHMRQLQEIVEDYEQEHGPLDVDGVREALAEWPDAD